MNANKAFREKGDFTRIAATKQTTSDEGTSISATFLCVTVEK